MKVGKLISKPLSSESLALALETQNPKPRNSNQELVLNAFLEQGQSASDTPKFRRNPGNRPGQAKGRAIGDMRSPVLKKKLRNQMGRNGGKGLEETLLV